ncbi:MAG: cell wall metabolism sensor histidine kinase WalK, partial [Chloroflexi bacterium]|nr:cell wall metabolism sensor histidine kinase WalK [Chloroflexota bacterium]
SRLLNAIEAQTGSPCFIFDASGHLLGTSSGVTAWPAVALPAAPHGSAAHPAALASATVTSNASPNSNVYLMPLFNNEWNLVGTMAFYQSTREMRNSQFTVQGLFLALLFAAFLVSATVAWLFSRMIAKPIQQLVLATDEIASGRYDHPITVRGSDEIGRLTIAFERMRRRIREATAALTDEKARSEAEAAVVNAVLNATNDGIMMVDSQRHLRVINQRWAGMFGLNTAALHGMLADDLHYQLSLLMDEPEKFRETSRALLEDSSRYVLDEEWVQRSPESRYLRRFSAPVRAADGSIIGRVFVYTDVTREHEADELKQALLSTVSHELRTPLATIKGYARTLLLEDWEVDTRRDFIHIIDEEADKLSELVGNLLDLSKLEAGVLQIQRQPVRLDDLLRRVAGRQHDPKQTHVYRVDLPSDLPLTWVDPRRIEQVVENLLENGTKYSQGGEIVIRARDQGDFIEITVQDHGQGIPQDHAERIFERFYRMDNRLTRETGGTGLGLSICRGLVEAHGGRIWVKETSSRGTIIAFTVPVLTSEIDETPPSPSNTVPVTLP